MPTPVTETLTVGLIGCGRIGAQTLDRVRETTPPGWLPLNHAEAIISLKDLSLIALCDLSEERLSWAAATYGVQQCFTDYQTLILETKPDILAIATRTPGRCDIIEFAAHHGVKGIHAEKPLGRNMRECRKALNAAAENDVKLTYGATRSFMESYRRAKEMVASGEIGEVEEICIDHGRTLLMWNHPHSVDLLIFFSGSRDCDYVQATCAINQDAVAANIVDDDPVIENALIKFANGINGVITSSAGMNTRVSGTQGHLIVAADGSWIEIHKKNNPSSPYHLLAEKIRVESPLSATQRAFQELAAAVRGQQELLRQPEDIAASMQILFTMVLSSLRGGLRTPLSELDDEFTITGKYGKFYA